MADFISDKEMEALEKKQGQGGDDFISDDDMLHLESASMPPLPKYDPMGGLESALAGMGQAPTLGYAPEIAGKVLGPKAKSSYNKALESNPALSFVGEMAGGAALGTGLGKIVPATRAAQGLLGGAIGAAQNIPEQDSNYDAIIERLKNAGTGLAFGTAFGGGKERMKNSAEEAAFKALGPNKKAAKDALARGNVNSIGRTLLDEGVIGNIPRSQDTMLERAQSAREIVGAKKGQLINQIQAASENFANQEAQKLMDAIPLDPKRIPQAGKVEYGLDVQKIKDAIRKDLNISSDLDGGDINEQIDKLLEKFSKGKKFIGIKEADKLKTEAGTLVKKWYSGQASEPIKQQYFKSLYSKLNDGIDETAEFLAKKFNMPIGKELGESKKAYGNLATSEKILEDKIAGNAANRMVSLSDYGMIIGGAGVGASRGSDYKDSAMTGAAVGLIHNFLRRYGRQIQAKQLNNLVGAMDRLGIMAPTAQTIAIPGVEAASKINLRKKALEK